MVSALCENSTVSRITGMIMQYILILIAKPKGKATNRDTLSFGICYIILCV